MKFTFNKSITFLVALVVMATISDIHFANAFETDTNEAEINEDGGRRVWVTYRPGLHDQVQQILDDFPIFSRLRANGRLRQSGFPAIKKVFDFERINAMVITASDEEIEILKADKNVLSVEDDVKRYLQYMPNTVRKLQWGDSDGQQTPYGIEMVQADQAWRNNVTGQGVKVCVLDTGIDAFHEDFDSLDGLETRSLDWESDGVGHGTHVSGTIAAADNDLGVVGVAPDAEIYTIKVFSDSGQFAYASGLVDAAYKCQEAGANIVSMSLGGPLPSFSEWFAYDRLFDEGVLVIAAAGNNGSSRRGFPASYNGVISVGALDEQKKRASFSQYNSRVDIAAPGVDVLSTFPMNGGCQICGRSRNNYGSISGTSMATPHVSGVAALLWSYKPEASIQEIHDALLLSAEDLGDSGRDDQYGYGLVQAMDALAMLDE